MMRRHLSRSIDFYGERGLVLFRKHASRYLSLYPWKADFRKQLMMVSEAEEFMDLVEANI